MHAYDDLKPNKMQNILSESNPGLHLLMSNYMLTLREFQPPFQQL